MNTRITYSYQDAQGQEVRESLVLVGPMSDADGALINKMLHNNQYFIPSQVGLDNLQTRLGRDVGDDDSIWHRWEWRGVSPTSEPATIDLKASTLVECFEYAVWDQLSATAELYGQPLHRPVMRASM